MGVDGSLKDCESGPVLRRRPRRLRGPRRTLSRFWRGFVMAPLQQVQAESRAYLASPQGQRADWKVMIILVTVAACVALLRYLSLPWLLGPVFALLIRLTNLDFLSQAEATVYEMHWCLVCLLSYFVIPALVIRFVLKEPIRNYGVKLKGAFSAFWLYAVMASIMVPLVFLMSADMHFRRTYPFRHLAADETFWRNLWLWELQYAVQFFALEFFFRGFMLHGLKYRFGAYAIFVMMVPYCMIHFGKPVQETYAAIIAGIILGFMSLKTRSIWMGAALHVSVALSMDFASLWRKGFFS